MSRRRSGGGGPRDGESRWKEGWAGGREPQRRVGPGGRWHLWGGLPGIWGCARESPETRALLAMALGDVEEGMTVKTGPELQRGE